MNMKYNHIIGIDEAHTDESWAAGKIIGYPGTHAPGRLVP